MAKINIKDKFYLSDGVTGGGVKWDGSFWLERDYGPGYDEVVLKGGAHYKRSSVLSGQYVNMRIENFKTVEEAETETGLKLENNYVTDNKHITVSHLPGPDDPDPYGDIAAAADDY